MQRRPLGAWESGFRSAHDMLNGTMLVTSCIHVKAVLEFEKIKLAFHYLFQAHPLLQATITAHGYNSFFNLNAEFENIPIELGDSKIEWQKQFETEIHTLLVPSQYLWRVKIQLHPLKQDEFYLLFTHHHAIADALSIVNLVEQFMQIYDGLLQGQTYKLDALPFLTNVEQLLQETQNWEIFKSNFETNQIIPLDKIPYDTHVTISERVSKNKFFQIPFTVLNELLTKCRQYNVTFNSLLNAIILQTQHDLQPNYQNISLKTPVNLRSYCQPVIEKKHIGCFLSIVETRHQLYQTSSIWQLAKDFQHTLYKMIPLTGFLPKKIDYAEIDIALAAQLFGVESAKRRKFLPNTFGVSNIGNVTIKTMFNSVQLMDFVFSTNHLVGNYYMFLSALTIHQQLRLIFTYVSPLISTKNADAFIDLFIQKLVNLVY